MSHIIVFIGIVLGNCMTELTHSSQNWMQIGHDTFVQALTLFTHFICSKIK